MNKALLLVPMLAISHLVQAEAVQYQVGLSGSHSSSDKTSAWDVGIFNSQNSSYTLGLSGEYFLSPIETTGAVRNELIFVRRANYISALVQRFEYKGAYNLEFSDGDTFSSEPQVGYNTGAISGQYFVSENTFIGAGYTNSSEGDTDGIVGIQGGYYYGETSAVIAYVSQSIGESDSTSIAIHNKSLLALNETSSLAYSLGLDTDVDQAEETVSVEFSTTYYFTDYTGLGVSGGYHIDTSEFGYSLSFSHFFNDNIGLNARVAEPDEGLDDYHYSIGIVGRF